MKTLKDFEVKRRSWAETMSNAGRKYTTDIDGLRRLAIAWVKEYFRREKMREGVVDSRHGSMYLEGKEDIVWSSMAFSLMNFFNIEEDDLE